VASKGDIARDKNGTRYGADALTLDDRVAEKLAAEMGVGIHRGADFALAEVCVR
jgi:hypothetical protein